MRPFLQRCHQVKLGPPSSRKRAIQSKVWRCRHRHFCGPFYEVSNLGSIGHGWGKAENCQNLASGLPEGISGLLRSNRNKPRPDGQPSGFALPDLQAQMRLGECDAEDSHRPEHLTSVSLSHRQLNLPTRLFTECPCGQKTRLPSQGTLRPHRAAQTRHPLRVFPMPWLNSSLSIPGPTTQRCPSANFKGGTSFQHKPSSAQNKSTGCIHCPAQPKKNPD